MQMSLSLYTEFVNMMKNDLSFVIPDKNGLGVCNLAVKELCRATANFIGAADSDKSS